MPTIENLIGEAAARTLADAGYVVVHDSRAKVTTPWRCPRCTAEAGQHGKGPCVERGKKTQQNESACTGLVCECDFDEGDEDDHGDTWKTPCSHAFCYHCEWSGTFPKPPSKATAWEKKALEAGWAPPPQRAVELGLGVSASPSPGEPQ